MPICAVSLQNGPNTEQRPVLHGALVPYWFIYKCFVLFMVCLYLLVRAELPEGDGPTLLVSMGALWVRL